jgi:nuclear pore complex protein Nup133
MVSVLIDRVSQAYDLAEHHNDYETLVWLCHDTMAGRAGSAGGKSDGIVRLQGYIERFGEEFAFVLYQWYIDQSELGSSR